LLPVVGNASSSGNTNLLEQSQLRRLPAKLVVRLNATIATDVPNREALPLERWRHQ
jgi:hypothetical protein